ncbi:MAG: amidohydrolase family protein, partial [Chloroflexi bacterium]|nr:amidohydrolase family protein [Chloroflexota bacterium]
MRRLLAFMLILVFYMPAIFNGPGLATAQNDTPPDIIFFNGTVLTMEGPNVEALAVQGDRIVQLGSTSDITALAGPQTVVIDLQGRTLMPGFVDAHTHVFNDHNVWGLDLLGAQELALENGITTLGNMYTTPEFLAEMQALDAAGELRVRTSLYLIHTTNCGEPVGDWYRAYPPSREPGAMLWISGIKIFADGGTCGAVARSYESPPGAGYGDLYVEVDSLAEVVRAAESDGYQVAIHALGDRAVETAQEAIALALDGGPNVMRHRIEHNASVRPELLSRYGEIGIVPVLFGQYPVCSIADFGGWAAPEYQDYEWPWRALLDANPGVPFAWHSDQPWVGSMNPLIQLYSLVTFNDINEADGTICEAPAWLQSHAITVDEALPMMTINAAYALFREQEVGSLVPGKLADLIILSDNPRTVELSDIKDIEVLMTMVGGQVEYCRSGYESWCAGTVSGTAPET